MSFMKDWFDFMDDVNLHEYWDKIYDDIVDEIPRGLTQQELKQIAEESRKAVKEAYEETMKESKRLDESYKRRILKTKEENEAYALGSAMIMISDAQKENKRLNTIIRNTSEVTKLENQPNRMRNLFVLIVSMAILLYMIYSM